MRRFKQALAAGAQIEVLAVFAFVRAHRADALGMHALASIDGAVGHVVGGVACAAQHDFVLGDIDGFALARFLRLVQRRQGGIGGEQARHVVGNVRNQSGGLAVGEAVKNHGAGISLSNRVVRAAAHLGRQAGLAESRHVHDNQRGIMLPKHFVGNAPVGPLAALGGFNQDVDVFDNLEQNLAALFGRNIQGNFALVATFLVDNAACGPAQVIGALDVFEPQNIGAHVGHEPAPGKDRPKKTWHGQLSRQTKDRIREDAD